MIDGQLRLMHSAIRVSKELVLRHARLVVFLLLAVKLLHHVLLADACNSCRFSVPDRPHNDFRVGVTLGAFFDGMF